MDYTQVERQLRQRVVEVVQLACRLFPAYANYPMPSVSFSYKGRVYGRAKLQTHEIMLNAEYGRQSDAINKLTVPHEVAHLVAYHLFGDNGHGRHWRRVCLALGGDGKRCGDAGERGVTIVPGRRTMQYRYRDAAGNDCWVGPVHHRRLQEKGATGYRLKSPCGARITHNDFLGETRAKA